jgi:hypothetical protein
VLGPDGNALNALHDAIAILTAELCRNEDSLREAVIGRLQEEASKARVAYPPDDRGMQHPWPVELGTLCETIERFALKPPLPGQPCDIAASAAGSVPPEANDKLSPKITVAPRRRSIRRKIDPT